MENVILFMEQLRVRETQKCEVEFTNQLYQKSRIDLFKTT
jgi:hypothetical protein